MATFPLIEAAQRCENAGANTAASRGTTISGQGATNTKGSYVQLIASTSFEANGILVMLDDCAAGIDYLIDIAVGAAASEVVILANLTASAGTGAIVYGAHYFFPIKIPAGTRISARCQAAVIGNSSVRVSCLLFGGGMLAPETLGIVTTLGAATADSGGTSIDPGGSANTKGSFVEITASTPYAIRMLTIGIGNQTNGVRSSQSWLVDIAVGAAGSEVVILPNVVLNTSTSPDTIVPQTYNQLPVNIPAGTRISVRAQSDGTDATDRLFDIILYGVS